MLPADHRAQLEAIIESGDKNITVRDRLEAMRLLHAHPEIEDATVAAVAELAGLEGKELDRILVAMFDGYLSPHAERTEPKVYRPLEAERIEQRARELMGRWIEDRDAADTTAPSASAEALPEPTRETAMPEDRGKTHKDVPAPLPEGLTEEDLNMAWRGTPW